MDNEQEKYAELWQLISNAQHLVVFTGAGVSTLSGIKDFRGKDGLYNQPDTDKMFDIDVFYRDPSLYYGLAKDFIYGLKEKQPSVVHIVLAELEKRGMLKALITQNIDLLHQKAGSKRVIEIHGSPEEHYCIKCSYTTDFETVAETAHTGAVPYCPQCGGTLKPAITFFGESLPARALMEAQSECEAADLLLVLGTSLVVYPAASLPQVTQHSGGKVVIVNNQPTYFDSAAALCCTDLEQSFEYLRTKFV